MRRSSQRPIVSYWRLTDLKPLSQYIQIFTPITKEKFVLKQIWKILPKKYYFLLSFTRFEVKFHQTDTAEQCSHNGNKGLSNHNGKKGLFNNYVLAFKVNNRRSTITNTLITHGYKLFKRRDPAKVSATLIWLNWEHYYLLL